MPLIQCTMFQFYMKTGVCKFGERCRFHHPIDRSAPSQSDSAAQQAVKLTPAGLPRREVCLVFHIAFFKALVLYDGAAPFLYALNLIQYFIFQIAHRHIFLSMPLLYFSIAFLALRITLSERVLAKQLVISRLMM